MNERDIFMAAIEINDPERRAAYVEKACGDDASLRANVQSLLASHDRSSKFLETPAASESAIERTMLSGADSEDAPLPSSTGETEFRRYLAPTTRDGSLGRLAHYEVEKIIGRGAFGIVAKAFDEKLHREVAIKMLSPELATTSPPRKRFLREARSAAAVTHDNLVGIYAVEDEPIPFLVMEYISGETLQEQLIQNGPLEVLDVVRIGRQIATGMAAAHKANLIHRDIKPSNILLSGGADVLAKISDFGMARAVDDASMTTSGMIAGTPMYMAPEQARGEMLDHRADIFSLGSVLYQMATGRPPFRASSTMVVLKRVCEDNPRSLADVLPGTPQWLETIIFRLLEKNPDDRFQSAQDVASLLARCEDELNTQGTVTCVESLPALAGTTRREIEKPQRSDREVRRRTALVFAVFIAFAALILVVVLSSNRDQRVDHSSVRNQASTATIPITAVAPFTPQEATEYQEAWAKHLGLPVELENSIGMKFRLVPPGEFTMGSSAQEIEEALAAAPNERHWRNSIKSEGPQHHVVLTKPMYVSIHEVTQEEYERVIGATPSSFSESGNDKSRVRDLDTSQHPVEMVSWEEAIEFCAKLSELERSNATVASQFSPEYRLLTEAEWEFACRAGTTTPHWSGDDANLFEIGWTGTNSNGRTHPVGELRANPFGLYDVHGNVWEWVLDSWDPEYYEEFTARAATDPVHDDVADLHRVVRGGLWGHFETDCRSSFRFSFPPSRRENFIGLRIAMDATVAKAESD